MKNLWKWFRSLFSPKQETLPSPFVEAFDRALLRQLEELKNAQKKAPAGVMVVDSEFSVARTSVGLLKIASAGAWRSTDDNSLPRL